MKQQKFSFSNFFLPVEIWWEFLGRDMLQEGRGGKADRQAGHDWRLDGQVICQMSNFSLGASISVRLVILINAVLELGFGKGITRA